MHERCAVAIVGAGVGGLALATGLTEEGMEDYLVLERSDGVGGTWRQNTYPGAACDVPSHLYSYSFAPNPDWSRAYARQPEILAYLERCADRAGIRSHLRTRWQVAEAIWDEKGSVWTLRSTDGDEVTAAVVVFATGTFTEPRLPDIEGVDRFAGPVLHSARWDHSVDLDDRRVGVIGTGASGAQIIPEIAPRARHTTVFLRTPPYVLPRRDPPFSDEDRRRFAENPTAMASLRRELYDIFESATTFERGNRVAEIITEMALDHLRDAVADPGLRATLTPDYPLGCNRTLITSDFYPALQRDDVTVETAPIEAVDTDGVVTTDGRHPVDVLVLATGFHAGEYLAGIEVVGRGGVALADAWADAPRAYLGMTVTGFPNLFVFYGPNTNQGGNSIILILEAQAGYVRQALAAMRDAGVAALDVRPDVFEAYDAAIQAAMVDTVWTSGCHSYFTDDSGRVVTQLPHSSSWYAARTATFDLADYRTSEPD